jgi:hypothetical protein
MQAADKWLWWLGMRVVPNHSSAGASDLSSCCSFHRSQDNEQLLDQNQATSVINPDRVAL